MKLSLQQCSKGQRFQKYSNEMIIWVTSLLKKPHCCLFDDDLATKTLERERERERDKFQKTTDSKVEAIISSEGDFSCNLHMFNMLCHRKIIKSIKTKKN